jgi:serine/threonine protein kinase
MLIDRNNNILLSDFGIAVLTHSSHSSVAQGPAGTYFYMAPEQITGKALSASDQYALGITVYEWLCGKVPFVGSITEITAKHLHIPPPPFRDKGIDIEPQVETVIRRTLEKDPQQRFASVQEFALTLQNRSNAQQGKNMHIPVPSSHNSIFPSPSPKTPDFTYPSTSVPPVPPRLIPNITHTVQSPTSGIPPSSITPTILPGNVPYTPIQPVSQYVQPHKTGSRLVTILISVVLLVLIVGVSAFALSKISQDNSESLSPGATATPTQAATATPTQAATATPTPRVVAVDPNETNTVRGFADGFCSDLFWKDHEHAYNYRMSVKYTKDHPDENQFAQEPFFSGGGCEYNTPLIVNNAWRVVFHIGSVNSPTNYTATIIHDPESNGDLRVNAIQ